MERPSRHWQGASDILSVNSDTTLLIRHLLSTANFGYLQARAVEIRKQLQPETPPQTICEINKERFTAGFNNLVMELAFSDGIYWIVRIPFREISEDDRISFLSEIATMRIVKRQTTVPIPKIYGFEASPKGLFGYPYIFMECINGRSLDNGPARAVPQRHHLKVAMQLANVFAELQNLTFPRIGRLWCGEKADQPVEIISMAWHASPGPLNTSFEFFFHQMQSQSDEIMETHPGSSEWLTACLVLKSALTHMIIEDRINGPFPLCHLDLHYGNMLFDDDYNLVAIIDWSDAQAAPLEQLSVSPEFATFPGLSEEENRPIIEFKKLVIQNLKKREVELGSHQLREKQGFPREDSTKVTLLSSYLESKNAEITFRHYMASPKGSLFAARMVAKLMYGDSITWEQLKETCSNISML